jgi:hypothetical protein
MKYKYINTWSIQKDVFKYSVNDLLKSTSEEGDILQKKRLYHLAFSDTFAEVN